jgi:hypothetical protein
METATVTCTTSDCPKSGVPIENVPVGMDEEGGTHWVDAVICGVCGQPITDVDPPLPGKATPN